MARSLPRRFICRSDLVLPHLEVWKLCDIAIQSGITEKTLRKIMRGEGVAFSTVKKLARWLKLGTNEVLQDSQDTLGKFSGAHVEFRIELSLDAVVESKHQSEAVVHHILSFLTNKGIKAIVLDSRMVQDEYADGKRRVLVRLRGDWSQAEHFPYVYIAVRPSRYGEFAKTVQSEPIDLRRCERFGEIVVWDDLRPISEMLRYPAPVPEYAVGPCRYVLERISEPYIRSIVAPEGFSLRSSPRPGKMQGEVQPAIGKGNRETGPKYFELAVGEDILYNLLWIDRIHGLDWLE